MFLFSLLNRFRHKYDIKLFEITSKIDYEIEWPFEIDCNGNYFYYDRMILYVIIFV